MPDPLYDIDSILRWVFAFLIIVAVLSGGFFAINWFLKPAQEELERRTYEQSRTHVEGAVDDIMRYRLQWRKADGRQHKEMIESMILRRARDVDLEDMPRRIRPFVDSLQSAHAQP